MKNTIIRSKYIILIIFITLLFLVFNLMDIKLLQALMLLSIFSVVFYYIYNKKTAVDDIITMVMILGIIMRIGYTLYTPVETRSVDLFGVDNGHYNYISNILSGHLPDNNDYQFYHPPFFHFLAAVASKTIGMLKYGGLQYKERIVEAAKIVSCFASCVTLIATKKIAQELNIHKKGILIAVVLTAFLPNHYLLAGRVNNDSLAIMFMYIALLYTIRWYKNNTYKNVICIGLSIGFGMMTKISVGTLAFVTGPVMLYVWFKNIKAKKGLKIFWQLAAFGVICFPLALWYPLRNYILFDQPLNYVYKMLETNPLYRGNVSMINRFFSFPFVDGISSVYNDPLTDSNLWIFLLRSGLFGEFSFDVNSFIPRVLIIVYFTINIFSLLAMKSVLCSKKIPLFTKYFVGMTWLVTFVSFIGFNIAYPFSCTMDFRYILPLSLVGSLAMGFFYDDLTEADDDKANYVTMKIVDVLCMLFAFCSVIMYTTINY